jgi:hypothetical protein
MLTRIFVDLTRNEPRIVSQTAMALLARGSHFYIHSPGTKRAAYSISDGYGYTRPWSSLLHSQP